MLSTNYTSDQYVCILSADSWAHIREVFNREDRSNDLIVDRMTLVKELEQDALVSTIKDQPVFYVGVLGLHISVAQVLRHIQDEVAEGIRADPSALQWITLGELESYFRTLRKALVTRLGADPDREFHLQLPKEFLQLLKDTFDAVPRVIDGYVRRDDFFSACLSDVQVQAILEEESLKWQDSAGKELRETVQQSLYRLSVETRPVICWLDVVKFFSNPEYKMYAHFMVVKAAKIALIGDI